MPNRPTAPPGRASSPRAYRLTASFQEFVAQNVSGGGLLLLATIAALVWVNSPWAAAYDRLWATEAIIAVGSFTHDHTLREWVNDGLMALFFFVVGLEIKRELLAGELRSFRRAVLPVVAALGGMVVPAAIYYALNRGGDGANGWGIPMATDIGFALAVVTILARWIPVAARVFLVALAIVDDLGAVVVIGLFYTDAIAWGPLLLAVGFLVALLAANLLGLHGTLLYAIGGLAVWLAMFASGIHASIAGALVALTIPARSGVPVPHLVEQGRHLLESLDDAFRSGSTAAGITSRGSSILGDPDQQHAVARLADASRLSLTPLQRMEHALGPWSAYVILPVFALANAGIVFDTGWSAYLTDPIAYGIVAGLVIGKPVGIVLATWLAVRSGLGTLAGGLTWRHIVGLGCLAGIGFTMSLFVSNLAFTGPERIETAKFGIFAASIIAASIGVAILRRGSSARSDTGSRSDTTGRPIAPRASATID